MLQGLVDAGLLSLGNESIRVATLSNEIGSIVKKLIACRCYALALDLNDRVKQLYQRNYDLEKIQGPLKVEQDIYKRMHEDQR